MGCNSDIARAGRPTGRVLLKASITNNWKKNLKTGVKNLPVGITKFYPVPLRDRALSTVQWDFYQLIRHAY